MESSEGQSMAFAVFLFAMAITAVLVMMMLTVFNDGALFSKDITGQINEETSSVRKNSVVTSILHDKVMRAQSDGGKGLSNDYGDMRAYRLISYYSAEGDYVYIGEDRVSKSNVKSDLKKYFQYKAGEYYNAGSTNADYYLSLGNDDLVVSKEENFPEKSWEQTTRRIPLAGGKGVQFGLWIRTEGSIYGDSS